MEKSNSTSIRAITSRKSFLSIAPSEETKKLVCEYYEAQGLTPRFVTNCIKYCGLLFERNPKDILLVANKVQRKIAAILGNNVAILSDAETAARQFVTLKEVFLMLTQKGVPCYMFNRPALINKFHYTKSAIKRIENKIDFPKILANQEKYVDSLKEILGELYSPTYVEHLGRISQVIKLGTAYVHDDMQSELVNIFGGKRVVINQPVNCKMTIHMYGRCGVFGYAVEDKDNIPSQLQRKLINNGYTDIAVVNHGLWGGDDAFINHNIIHDAQTMKTGDIVVIYMEHFSTPELAKFQELGLHYLDCTKKFHEREESRWAFFDRPGHANRQGYDVLSDIILDKLIGTEFKCKDIMPSVLSRGVEGEYIKLYLKNDDEDPFLLDLHRYLEEINKKYPINKNIKCGAIIMNCNPFTFGHRYLIDYASQKVERLFIFVVEEDKSFFKFKDRFTLVQKGTQDLKNVIVLPSREFMISAYTFPEYFNKDYVQNIEIDVTRDLQVFCMHIAPGLNITVRFAGEEPIDMITKSYNDNMRRILPQYSIEFVEIPRLQVSNEGVVSASKVRRFLEEAKYEELKKYVPPTTYEYLMENYADKKEML